MALATTLLVSVLTGWRMWYLYRHDTLWGHLPLYFFLAVWLSVVLFFWKKYTRHPKGLRWLGLSTLSGILLSLGFPPLPLTFLLFVAWIPLLITEHEIAQEKKKVSLFPYAFHCFALWNVLVTWWVGNTAFIAGFFAFFLNALFMCVPFLLFHKTKKVLPRVGYMALAAYWMSFEMLHLHWEMAWPWLNLGNAFGQTPAWVQWYEYTGAFGGTLWILVANVLLFNVLSKSSFSFSIKKIWKENTGGVLFFFIIIIIPIVASQWMYHHRENKGREVEVVVVQPNLEPHYEKFNISLDQQIAHYLEMADTAVTERTAYLVFPETSFWGVREDRLFQNRYVQQLKAFLSRHPGLKIITGISSQRLFRPGEPHTGATREHKNNDGSSLFWEAHNAAIQIDATDSIQLYVKGKLVPGAEITPYRKIFFFLEPVVKQLGGSLEGHGVSDRRKVFVSDSGRVAPVICYESVFGDYLAGYIRAGAEAIFIVTNDGWWDNTPGYQQHVKYASLRAIETRRSIARSANVGTTCFLNQRGDILQPTQYGKAAAVRGTIRFNNEMTFYVNWGDLIGRVSLFLAAILFLNTLARVPK